MDVEDEEISFIVGQSELNSRNYQEVLEQDIRTVFAEEMPQPKGISRKLLAFLRMRLSSMKIVALFM